MNRKSSFQLGLFCPRALFGIVLCATGSLVALVSVSATSQTQTHVDCSTAALVAAINAANADRNSKLSFHCLRHTSVTLLKEAGIPDAAIMALIGHDSVAMSQHYTHVGREALEKAANAMPDLTD